MLTSFLDRFGQGRLSPLFDWLKRLYAQSPLFRGVVQVIPWVGPLLDELLAQGEESGLETYDDIRQVCGEIDWQLLNSIGDYVAGPGKDRLNAEAIMESYRLQMSASLDNHNLNREDALRELQWPSNLSDLTSTIPRPDLTIEVDGQEERVEFILRGEKSLTVEGAELLWDCSCNEDAVVEQYESEDATDPSEECPIHNDSEIAKQIDSSFSNGLVEIVYEETSVLWRQKPQFWPPSIDAFHFVEDLKKDGLYGDSSIRKVLDLGCGTGFIGQRLASLNESISHIKYSDWLLTPVAYSALNWYRQGELSSRTSIDLHVGIGVEQTDLTKQSWSLTREKPYDVVLCNPPYLPLPKPIQGDAQTIPLESTVSGTALLQSVIRNSKSLTDQLYVAFSNIALPEATKAAGEVGLSLKKVGPSRAVPFRVPVALQHRDYIEWLLEERSLDYRSGSRHRLWHRVATYTVS